MNASNYMETLRSREKVAAILIVIWLFVGLAGFLWGFALSPGSAVVFGFVAQVLWGAIYLAGYLVYSVITKIRGSWMVVKEYEAKKGRCRVKPKTLAMKQTLFFLLLVLSVVGCLSNKGYINIADDAPDVKRFITIYPGYNVSIYGDYMEPVVQVIYVAEEEGQTIKLYVEIKRSTKEIVRTVVEVWEGNDPTSSTYKPSEFFERKHISNGDETSEDYTAEDLARMPAEELAKLVPGKVLERFTPEELANFTPDELKHIVPTKFAEPETQYPTNITEPIKVGRE